MTLALDISHFTQEGSGPLTTKQLDDAWDAGVRVFRPSIANQTIAVQQIDAIVDHPQPFDIWTYRYYYFARGMWTVDTDKAFIQRVRDLKYNIQKHSIDVEDTDPDWSVKDRIDITHMWIKGFENFCPTDMYTAQWYWQQYMGNTKEFSFMPLWFARWPFSQQPDLSLTPGFGGWAKGSMHQYIGDTTFAGIWCDVNYYEEQAAPIPVPEPTPPVTVYIPDTRYDYRGVQAGEHIYQEGFRWLKDAPPEGPGPRVEKSPLIWHPEGNYWENTTKLYKHW